MPRGTWELQGRRAGGPAVRESGYIVDCYKYCPWWCQKPGGRARTRGFTLLRPSIPTVEDRGDATAWRETLRPHDSPARPESNGGIYYEVVRSKGMYLLRRSPESSDTAECPRCRKTLQSLSGVGIAAAPSRSIAQAVPWIPPHKKANEEREGQDSPAVLHNWTTRAKGMTP